MIKRYLNEIIQKHKTGQAQEHTYRKTLEDLLVNTANSKIQVINEPKKQKCGKPDYIILRKNIPIGYIEAKDVYINLDDIEHSEQLIRYRSSLENLLLTNYLEFRFFVNGEKVNTIAIAEVKNNRITAYDSEFNTLTNYIKIFCTHQTQTINSPQQLAHLMAQKAILIRDVIVNTLKSYTTGSLANQRKIFKETLLHDLTDHTFADMYAQTIAYGLFVARLNDTSLDDFSRQEARDLVSRNNPFLRQLFDYISGANLDDNLIWIVDDLVEIFRSTDLNKLLKNYGQVTQTSDPFLHFYETFLENYDEANKKKRGVYYTPQPVVRFIVSSVDTLLKNEFKLAHGLADDTKTTIKLPDNSHKKTKRFTEAETYKVQILDPATGTGTFLAETIRKIYSCFANQKGIWSQYVDKALIPRLNGFEIMMTPYVMCHLKLDLLLRETGYTATGKANRFNVYLTNALEKNETTNLPLLDLWLADEVKQAGRIKSEAPLMVVMGNPPYSGESANENLFNDNLDDYKKEPTGEKLNEKVLKWINDDYVKFLRLAQNFVDKNNEGIIAFVNNHSYLDNPTFRGMRYSLLKSFDKIYVIDLHGNAKRNEICPDGSKDENIFDIQQGVSINIFVKTGRKRPKKLAQIYHTELFGLRKNKFEYLNNNTFDTIKYKELEPIKPYYFFVPKDFENAACYNKGINIKTLFNIGSVGIVTARDSLCIQNSKEQIIHIANDFSSLNVEEARNKYKLGKDVRDWKVYFAQKDLINSKLSKDNFIKIAYRPFDDKWTYYTGKSKGFHCMPRGETMHHMLFSDNVALTCCKQIKAFDTYQHCFISKYAIESCLVSNKTSEITYLFPLYLYTAGQSSFFVRNRKPNLNMDIVQKLEQKLQLTFTPEKENAEDTFAPIDILDYIYGILHSNKYRSKYKEFLKIDFPRIPYPENTDYFFEITELGSKLRKIHLMEDSELENLITAYPVSGENKVENLKYKDNKVYINKAQYFDNVPETTWNFYIGGYQPAQKWLKDRKGRILGYDEIIHYQKIIAAITKTITLMDEIDTIIKL